MLINSQKTLPLLTTKQNLNESQQKIARENLGGFTSENLLSDSVSQEFYGTLTTEWTPSDRNTYFTQTVTVNDIPTENCKYIITYSESRIDYALPFKIMVVKK